MPVIEDRSPYFACAEFGLDDRSAAHQAGMPLTRLCDFCPDRADFLDARSDGLIAYQCRSCHRIALVAPEAR